MQTIKSVNKVLKIERDTYISSPRSDCNTTRMIFLGNHSHLGDAHDFNPKNKYESREDLIEQGAKDVINYMKRVEGQTVAIIKPVHLYSHGGTAISTNYGGQFADKWDSGTCGFVVITKEAIRENYSVKRITEEFLQKADVLIEGEIETLNQYIQGEVYRFTVEDYNGDDIDSCGGFYGDNFDENGLFEHVNEFPVELLKMENLEDSYKII